MIKLLQDIRPSGLHFDRKSTDTYIWLKPVITKRFPLRVCSSSYCRIRKLISFFTDNKLPVLCHGSEAWTLEVKVTKTDLQPAKLSL